ncbi:hypothetical protein [Larsenimonas suaedae]|uniref:Uncharacterized protein n=1 Tax=Larsenimonas suaedae TaxID=1851019 RepID=A0ABU1GYY5_9GAMM|nr:hypothetical protein [Larsenimonas suaedae]MCM2973740.1 hypothetical protein [Larsenimonas suaedae]MDR5897263.1 hypothetical protein [Larsenimonas suaedae]
MSLYTFDDALTDTASAHLADLAELPDFDHVLLMLDEQAREPSQTGFDPELDELTHRLHFEL